MAPDPDPRPTPPVGTVLSVQVGGPQAHSWLGREVVTSIFKHPVAGPVRVRRHNLEGDDQADRKSHGGADKAVYAYAREDEDWWESELDRPVPDGLFGENLTTAGLDLTNAVIGHLAGGDGGAAGDGTADPVLEAGPQAGRPRLPPPCGGVAPARGAAADPSGGCPPGR